MQEVTIFYFTPSLVTRTMNFLLSFYTFFSNFNFSMFLTFSVASCLLFSGVPVIREEENEDGTD